MRNSWNSTHRNRVHWMAALACVVTLVCGPALALAGPGGAAEKTAKPATVLIDAMAQFGPLEMAPAKFPHDKHTAEVFKKGETCTVCHSTGDFSFKGLPGKLNAKAAEDRFHSGCLTCHETWDEGPQTGECRQCHEPLQPHATNPVVFDKSLHAIHIASAKIAPSAGAPAGAPNCGACHHVFDAAAKKLVWAPGQEDACAACHAAEAVGNTPSLKDASHRSCVSCHVGESAKLLTQKADKGKDTSKKDEKASKDKKAAKAEKAEKDKKKSELQTPVNVFSGPVTCAGCHSPAAQAAFPRLTDPPRLMRGQPDATVMLPVNNAGEKKPLPGSGVNPVVFNHKAHEAATESCRVCHHVRIEDNGCSRCHTVEGRPEGQNVTQFTAMHKPDAQASCVGCHNQTVLQNKDCAGCHILLTPALKQGKADSSCAVCHAPVPGLDAVLGSKTVGEQDRRGLERVAEDVIARRKPVAPIDAADVPETVVIGALSDKYEPSVFPHRKIYQTLVRGMNGNGLAGAFHATPETVCAACHHNVPAATLAEPPKCVTCHSDTVGAAVPGKPMPLKQAYHQQCMACHEIMNVKPVATDCTACHAQRPAAQVR